MRHCLAFLILIAWTVPHCVAGTEQEKIAAVVGHNDVEPAAHLFGIKDPHRLYAQDITVDGNSPGRVFEGIGAQSGGLTSKLLMDYPEPQRGHLLDLMFKPNFGAAVHHYKIEIGGDIVCTCGSTPSFAHTREECENPKKEYFDRGFESWIMTEAKKRRPDIVLSGIECGVPGWVGPKQIYSQDNADYYVAWIKGMKRYYGLDINYVGLWNEQLHDANFIKLLRRTLDKGELPMVKVVASDIVLDPWRITRELEQDPELNAAVAVLGAHYPGYVNKNQLYSSTLAAKQSGKPLWSSEDGPWHGDWRGVPKLAKSYNRNYVTGKMTSTIIWAPWTSYYSNPINIPHAGFMTANTPWSGYYLMEAAVWATAHTTQFAQPGWQYLDSGCGYLGCGGSFVSLKKPDPAGDWSMIIETMDTKTSQTITVRLAGGLRTDAPVHLWRTNEKQWFERIGQVIPKDGEFSMLLDPESIYSLTTTTGQSKGDIPPPPDKPFPLPYSDNFDQLADSQLPKYFHNYAGSFEGAPDGNGQGRCLRQMVPELGWQWDEPTPHPYIYLGDLEWTNYEVSMDALIETTGTVTLYGRFYAYTRDQRKARGYRLEADHAGDWRLCVDDTVLTSGTTPVAPQQWRAMKLRFEGEQITALIDDKQLAQLSDKTHPKGRVGLGSGWNYARFDNFSVRPLATTAAPAATTKPDEVYDPEKRGIVNGIAR